MCVMVSVGVLCGSLVWFVVACRGVFYVWCFRVKSVVV